MYEDESSGTEYTDDEAHEDEEVEVERVCRFVFEKLVADWYLEFFPGPQL